MIEVKSKPLSPVLTEDRVIQDNLLQELNELVGKVSGHEGLDCNGHFLWILGLRQGCLDNLQRRKTDALFFFYVNIWKIILKT